MLAHWNSTWNDEILSDMETIGKDGNLYEEKNFSLRRQAIDDIEFHVIDRIHALAETAELSDETNVLKHSAEMVKARLEEVDTKLFDHLRMGISSGEYRGKLLMELIDEHLDNKISEFLQSDTIGYDNLDLFLNGLLTSQHLPAETIAREPGMVYYQKTPARIIFELIKRAAFKPQDVFFDLGSGLGQPAILVNLLTAVNSKGVEFEPAFCRYANACVVELHLSEVEFIHADARYLDYSSGTVFFMYTPFEGKMLQDVLQNLKGEAEKRKIKIFTYGPCTPELAEQDWLINKSQIDYRKLGEFISV